MDNRLLQINIQKQNTAGSIGIKTVEIDGYEDVYNMEVDDNHNFAINGGLIVHNCMDSMRYFVKTKHIADDTETYNPLWN